MCSVRNSLIHETHLQLISLFQFSFASQRLYSDLMSSTEMATAFVVNNQHVKGWVPQTSEVDGRHFVRISKWDRCFVKFCIGAGLSFSGNGEQSINVAFLEGLQCLLTESANAAVRQAFKANVDDETTQKKKRVRKARAPDQDVASKVLVINAPELFHEEEVMPSRQLMVLRGVKNHDLWVELTVDNLEYIKFGVLAGLDSMQCGRSWKRRPESNVDAVGEDAKDESS